MVISPSIIKARTIVAERKIAVFKFGSLNTILLSDCRIGGR